MLRLILFSFLSVIFISFPAAAKTLVIDVTTAMESATFVQEIEVVAYDDSFLVALDLSTKKTIRLNALSRKWNKGLHEQLPPDHPARKSQEGRWPPIGSKVQVLHYKYNEHMRFLFAKLERSNYRFWDPLSIPFANSAFLIPTHTDYSPTSYCEEETKVNPAAAVICSDGFSMTKREFQRISLACHENVAP